MVLCFHAEKLKKMERGKPWIYNIYIIPSLTLLEQTSDKKVNHDIFYRQCSSDGQGKNAVKYGLVNPL